MSKIRKGPKIAAARVVREVESTMRVINEACDLLDEAETVFAGIFKPTAPARRKLNEARAKLSLLVPRRPRSPERDPDGVDAGLRVVP